MHRFMRALSAVITAALAAGALVVASPAPSQAKAVDLCDAAGALTGTGVVGSPLVAELPEWDLTVLSSTVSWLGNGSVFRTGGTSYTPTEADAGSVIQVQQAVTLLGAVACTWTSNAVPITSVLDPGDPGAPGDPGDPGEDLLTLLGGLQLPASAEVGQLITLTDPVWSLPGVATTYQWVRDGVPIPGADEPSYVPTLDDAGHALWAEVSGALLGVPGVTVVTDALDIPLVSSPQLSPVSDVTVTGSRKIGTSLGLTGPTWSEDGVTNKYQWLRDDAPIAGATGATYALVALDFGHAISVKVTGHKDGFTDNTITSDPVATVLGDGIQIVTKPRISGTGAVGRLLTADPGTWTGQGPDGLPPVFAYQWRRNDRAIPGAVAQTYQVEKADIGTRLSVTVTAVRTGYRPGTFRTADVTVPRLASALSGTLARTKVPAGRPAVLRLTVRVPGVSAPTGVIRVLDGKKLVKKVSLTAGKKGRTSVRLTRLKPGVHKLRAVYAGTARIASDTSKVLKLTVRKK